MSPMSNDGSSVVSLTEYTSVLRRWLPAIIIVSLIGAALGAVALWTRPVSYATEAIVQIRPILSQNDDPNLDAGRQISVESEIAIASSQRVAEKAVALRSITAATDDPAYGDPNVWAQTTSVTPENAEVLAALDRITVEALDKAEILRFTAEAKTAVEARNLANSTAHAYLSFRRDSTAVGQDKSRDRLEDREAELISELTSAEAELGAWAEENGVNRALDYATLSKRQELTIIGSKFANLRSLNIDPGVVLSDAKLPVSPTGMPFATGPIMGGLLGLAAAVGTVLLIDRSDDRLRSRRSEIAALGVPMLGTAPAMVKAPRGARSALFGETTPAGDAYRRLQSTLSFNLESSDKRLIVVAGVSRPGTSTSVAANLAAAAARAGRRTLLVGGDLRDRNLSGHLGMTATSGLTDVILSGSSLGQSIVPSPQIANLSLLAAGRKTDRPADVLSSEAFGRLLSAVSVEYDLVVVEAPPVLKVADAVEVARLADGVVLVADGEKETRQDIADSLTQLRGVGSDIVGVVVTGEK